MVVGDGLPTAGCRLPTYLMTTVIVGSTNPVKVASVRDAFHQALYHQAEVKGVRVISGVPDQPLSDKDTLLGARNRAHNARTQHPGADYWIGIEGGVEERKGQFEAFGWVCVLSSHHQSSARSATFPLPPSVGARLTRGEELGLVIDQLFDEENSKQKGGAVGLLSKELITREALYYQPIVLALLPFMQPDLYKK